MNTITPIFRSDAAAGATDPFRLLARQDTAESRLLAKIIAKVCRRIPPLWPLQHFVAVNPFMGLLDKPFEDACERISRVGHGDILMPADFYLAQIKQGKISDTDLAQALALTGHSLSVEQSKTLLLDARDQQSKAALLSLADFIDKQRGTHWAAFVTEEISKCCAAYFDQGQAAWRMPWRRLPLFNAWKRSALFDRSPEIAGLHGFRRRVSELAEMPMRAIEQVLHTLELPAGNLEDFLHRQLMSIAGWSAWVQHQQRAANAEDQKADALQQLLAIRLIYDYVLLMEIASEDELEAWRETLRTNTETQKQERQRLEILGLFQWAYEISRQRELLAKLTQPAAHVAATSLRPSLQAVFCIDVRSEVYRRALESVAQHAETLGFAGFFGFPIEYIPLGHHHGQAQCPVLIKPQFRIRESVSDASIDEMQRILHKRWQHKRLKKLWKAFKSSAVSCFSYVEIAGLSFGLKLCTDSLGTTRPAGKPGTAGIDSNVVERIGPMINRQRGRLTAHSPVIETGIGLSDRIELAAKALRGMGLTDRFARLVLFCGHGSSTVNNPYASALDCGACGGHSGEANARVAAAVLNDRDVRAGLAKQGLSIPKDTWFIGAQHNTTTDEVQLFDLDKVPHAFYDELQRLQVWLAEASRLARAERAAGLGLAQTPMSELERAVKQRSHDWAQVRPEWGLAGNSAFIVAPRTRTQHTQLGGRVFLHNYEHQHDPDGTLLEVIMTAPMVVASWINLQYFASTVNNSLFGSGNKVLHNVVGTFGVLEGNGGDLRVGLPWQSLHDGKDWRHEPVRLTVLVEAPAGAIEGILARHAEVRNLFEHHWLHLFRIESSDGSYHRYLGQGQWQAWPAILTQGADDA